MAGRRKSNIKEEIVIDVQDVHKSFRVYFDKGSMLKERFVDPGRGRYEEREVLKGVSFTVRRGETVALIGRNGCGKSTTLKMLTRILYPNSGTVAVNGKVSSLIELGAGFHPDMSGRENIYINASVLGLTRPDVDRRIDGIIRFSELEDYIDNPVRTYSSGMYMRLAFAVAINVDADILLIDEILAVGDQTFQEKCMHRLEELRQSGVTVVLVSHSMGQVQAIADRCIWIDEGKVREDGVTEIVCRHYGEEMERRAQARAEEEEEAIVRPGNENSGNKETGKEDRKTERPAIKERISRLMEGEGSAGFSLAVICAVLLLLFGHAAEKIYGMGKGPMDVPLGTLTRKMQMSCFAILSVGRIGVPMLLMLGGFLLRRKWEWKKLKFGTFRLLMALLWIVLFLFPGLDLYGQANGAEASIPSPVGALCYLWYVCAGYYLSFYYRRQLRGSREILLMPVLFLGTVASQMFLYARGVEYLIWYTWALTSMMAFFAFDVLVRLKLGEEWKKRMDGWIPAAVGALILHRPVQDVLMRHVFALHGGRFLLRTMGLWILSTAVSFAIALPIVNVFRGWKRMQMEP